MPKEGEGGTGIRQCLGMNQDAGLRAPVLRWPPSVSSWSCHDQSISLVFGREWVWESVTRQILGGMSCKVARLPGDCDFSGLHDLQQQHLIL